MKKSLNSKTEPIINAQQTTTSGEQSSLDWAVWGFPVALMLVIALIALGGQSWIDALCYDRVALQQGQWWRLVTGSLVHAPGNTVEWLGLHFLGPWHLFLNELGLVVLVLLCPEPLSSAVWLRRLLLLSLGMSAGLYFFTPQLRWYVGLSGVIHGMFVLGLVPQVLKKDIVALGCLLYLLGKLGYELYAGAPVSDEHAIGMPVALASHLWGSVAAVIYGLVFGVFWKPEVWNFRRKKKAA